MTGPSIEQIIATYNERKRDQGEFIAAMRRIRDTYNGDMVIPLPELDRNEMPAVINLVNMGLEQLADRAASVTPDIYYPPLRYGIQQSEDRARTRRRANLAWWQTNRMDRKLRRRARHLIGYATSPVMLRPNAKWGISKWEVRDPLNTFPCPSGDLDDITPTDCIYTFQRSYAWLEKHYPAQISALATGVSFGKRPDPSHRYDIIEYVDGDCFVLGALGRNTNGQHQSGPTTGSPFVELERLPNRAQVCPAVVPRRISLDRPMGQFDGMIGMYQTMAKLTALEVIAVERGIFPATFLVSRPNETARFLAGPYDGRTGLVNIVAGGDIKETAPNPGFATNTTIDRIENAARATGAIPMEFGGESPTNVRTGKRGDAVMSAIVDMPLQAAQETLADSLREENRIAVAQAKAYFGNDRKSFFIAGKNAGHVDYVPNRDFETDTNVVTYPLTGVDANGVAIGIGQRVGMGIMSKKTGAQLDPMVADPDLEVQRVQAEALDAALLQSISTQAAQGAIPPHDLARIKTLVAGGSTLEDAVEQAQQEAQARQATQVPQGAPEAQPGLAQPGQGAEQPEIPPPSQDQTNLADLMNALRRPVRQTPQEKGA